MDADRLARLYEDLGERAADTLICESMEQLARCLARIERGRKAGQLTEMSEAANDLAELSRHIGLNALAEVSTCLMETITRLDYPALAAVAARVSRVGDKSLSAIWDPENLSG